MPRWPATKTVLPFSSNGVLAIDNLPPGDCQIARDHLLDELGERRLRLPSQLFARLAGIADQEIDPGRTQVDRADAHQCLAGFSVDAGFLDVLSAPFDAAADFGK